MKRKPVLDCVAIYQKLNPDLEWPFTSHNYVVDLQSFEATWPAARATYEAYLRRFAISSAS